MHVWNKIRADGEGMRLFNKKSKLVCTEADIHSSRHLWTVIRTGVCIMLCTHNFTLPASSAACFRSSIRADAPLGGLLRQFRQLLCANGSKTGGGNVIYDGS